MAHGMTSIGAWETFSHLHLPLQTMLEYMTEQYNLVLMVLSFFTQQSLNKILHITFSTTFSWKINLCNLILNLDTEFFPRQCHHLLRIMKWYWTIICIWINANDLAHWCIYSSLNINVLTHCGQVAPYCIRRDQHWFRGLAPVRRQNNYLN